MVRFFEVSIHILGTEGESLLGEGVDLEGVDVALVVVKGLVHSFGVGLGEALEDGVDSFVFGEEGLGSECFCELQVEMLPKFVLYNRKEIVFVDESIPSSDKSASFRDKVENIGELNFVVISPLEPVVSLVPGVAGPQFVLKSLELLSRHPLFGHVIVHQEGGHIDMPGDNPVVEQFTFLFDKPLPLLGSGAKSESQNEMRNDIFS